ncbi:c-type cytochrome [Pseudohalioglobus lutimaris]|uniref:Cytochrome c n=1 Tax=Pseudohalioglobus lutimaris TaxID=1737061 RepID=A0A2N5X286_9GAMM|nr:cytochrome c [Pseudohalioglobus lutimaris]PLW68601.1 cytochrome c [Pseudohalioglobus lutimaris]
MSEVLTRSAARNIFYGGSLFFFILFAGLTAHTHWYMVNVSTNSETLTEEVKRGKHVWEEHSCINCHSILGEGAYFAPELGNVWTRYGGRDNPEAARAGLKGWIRAQPLNIPDRRVMPKIDLSEDELEALVDFLQWTDSIDTQDWPPTPAG